MTEDKTSDDIVMDAVNSVGFELDKRVWVDGQEYVCFRPKRKQTGWICVVCDPPCVQCTDDVITPPTACHARSAPRVDPPWRPFYGKVVE